jgi:hypothetical protein
MSENLTSVPVPPTQFSEDRRVNTTSKDALGSDLPWHQADVIVEGNRSSNAAYAQEYWADMQDFYRIDKEDTARRATERALETVRSDLLQQPETILGNNYRPKDKVEV